MKKDIKKAIIDATIKLIDEKGSNPDDITVRDICKEADVGVSLINYHFQTKENLIAQCVQTIIGSVIGKFPSMVKALPDMMPLERLKFMFNSTFTFLYSSENISRISILTDHQNPRRGDNTRQTTDAYLPLVEAVCRERNIENPRMVLTMLIQSIQGSFLRTDVIKEELGIDLRSPDEREKFIDGYIDIVFR